MPGLLRKLVIFAASDGIIVQPHGHGGSQRHAGLREPSAIRIDYKTNKVSPLSPSAADQADGRDGGLEAYGLVGKRRCVQSTCKTPLLREDLLACS